MVEPSQSPPPAPEPTDSPEPVAAVDLGSNSFHMVIGQMRAGALTIVDRLRETVRLAAGLRKNGSLEEETVERALACLERFGQRLRDIPPSRIRVVGTSTLRQADAAGDFLGEARELLGVPIEILAGAEEARLIYLGVAHDLAGDDGTRLVIDIGGGSTECVLGSRFEARRMTSVKMGCVSYSRRYFSSGELTKDAFRKAELAARLELKGIRRSFRREGWDSCVGSSGTIKAVGQILREEDWSDGEITLDALRRLRKEIIKQKAIKRLELPAMSAERAPVIPGGLAILTAVFESLKIERMEVSQSALREGLLHDLVGRIEHEDIRDRTVRNMGERYHVDASHAERVERTALQLFDDVARSWGLDEEEDRTMLGWAAYLHEVGLDVAYSGYHKHGAYLLANSDMPGFSQQGQQLLATLVRLHRRKFDKLALEDLPPFHKKRCRLLAALLRVAVVLNRGRSRRSPDPVHLEAGKSSGAARIRVPEGWHEEHPMTSADLDTETARLQAVGIELELAE